MEEKKENTSIILVIISACVFVIIVAMAGLFIFWPREGNTNEEYTYHSSDQDNSASESASKTEEGKAFFPNQNRNQDQSPDNGAPGSNGTDSSQSTAAQNGGNLNSGQQNPVPITSSIPYNFGDPKNDSNPGGNITKTPQVIIEGRDDFKSDFPVTKPAREITSTNEVASVYSRQTTNQVVPKNLSSTTTRQTPSLAQQQTRTISVREYWIQAASFKSRSRAESLNEKLKQLGYAGIIKTTNIEGETHFRVRLGPYANNNEADKFLGWIKKIDGLNESYVSQSTTQKTIN
jgi:cell division septation protein DedD